MSNALNLEDFLIPEIKRTRGLLWRYINGVYSTQEIVITTKGDGTDICKVTCVPPYYVVNWYERALDDKDIILKHKYEYATELVYHAYLVAECYMKKEKTEMSNNTSSMVVNVPGANIIFKNFSGSPRLYNENGNRDFALMIDKKTLKNALEAKGCIFKSIKDSETIFVKIKVPKNMGIFADSFVIYHNRDELFNVLDKTKIITANLELTFHKMVINGKEHTSIYLRNAKFYVEHGIEIRMYWPNINKTEETKMEKMTRAEVMGQLQMGITAYEMDEKAKRDPVIIKLKDAMKNAIEYIGEVPKTETKVKTVTVKEKVYALPEIKQVIFNYPATIVIWSDNVKTVVECQKGDNYSMEGGLAMCIAKRMMGNKSNFNKQIRKYTEDVKNVQTKKKPKEGTFEERKAARTAQAEANKKAKGKSKSKKKNALDNCRKRRSSPAIVNTGRMIVITEAYVECVRKKMAKRGITYDQIANATGIGKSTINRYFSPNVKCQKPKRMNIGNFKEINKALGIRWKIEE